MTLPAPLAGLSVVLVSDDLKGLRTEGDWLEGAGATLYAFEGAEAAVRGLISGIYPHVVVSDLYMEDLDAWQLSRLVRTTDFPGFSAAPVLVVSAGRSGPDVEAISKAAGAAAFLPLPTTRSQLIRYVALLARGEEPEPDRRAVLYSRDRALLRPIVRCLESKGSDVEIGDPKAPEGSCGTCDWIVWDALTCGSDFTGLLDERPREERRAAIIVLSDDVTPGSRLDLLMSGADAVFPRGVHFGLLGDLLLGLTRERALARVEEALRARGQAVSSAESRYERLFHAIPDMVLLVDEEGVAISGNLAAHKSLAGARESVAGLPLDDVMSPGLLAPLGRPSLIGGGEGEIQTLDRGVRRVEAVYQPVGPNDGPTLAVLRDVTERVASGERARMLESELLKGQKLESLGVMASGVAHDFNNLLLSILGNATLAAEDSGVNGPTRHFIDEIALAAERAAELTAQILAFSGQAGQTPESLELRDVVGELGRLLGPVLDKNATLHVEGDQAPYRVMGDPAQVRQVLMNLIVNASDALEGEPGRVCVHLGHAELDGSESFPWIGDPPPSGAYISVEVVDSGIGMTPETLDRIFDPFFTTKFTGRGLGLAAALGTVGAHGGGIYVETAPDQGARFTVYLPALSGAAGVANGVPVQGEDMKGEDMKRDEARDPPSPGGMVLVVDDEAPIRDLVSRILTRVGYEVVLATDGADALRLFEERRGEWVGVLLDTVMPVMDGEEAFRHIRIMDGTVPVVMTSGNLATRKDGEGGPIPDAWIQKPYRPADLRAVLEEVVGRSRSESFPARPA